MRDDDIEVAIRTERKLVQVYQEFVAEIRSARIELETELARLRAITRAIEAERDLGVPLQ
jgi:hypothetical protein